MDKRKHQQRDALYTRAERAIRGLYHNATPDYPRLDDEDGGRFLAWFEDAASAEIGYLRDGGANGRDPQKILEHPANAGRYKSAKARAYYVAKGMRAIRAERDDCGALTGWYVMELAAGNNALARTLRRTFKRAPEDMRRNNALWERISESGELYQYGRGGRTLAPDGLVKTGGGSSFWLREDYARELSYAAAVELVRVLESFNAYVGAWCRSVPEQWAELERERKAEERAERKRERDKKRAEQAARERCEHYPG